MPTRSRRGFDRLPLSRTLWRLVFLISLGGAFELYDIFLITYIAPSLVATGMFTSSAANLFSINGIGFFVFCTFAGMFVGCMGFGFVADRFGRRTIFISSLAWYSICTAIMAFQNTAAGVDAWRFIASIGVGLEQVTIDTYLPEFVPPKGRKSLRVLSICGVCMCSSGRAAGLAAGVPKRPFGLENWRYGWR